jgi:hypothetical protein
MKLSDCKFQIVALLLTASTSVSFAADCNKALPESTSINLALIRQDTIKKASGLQSEFTSIDEIVKALYSVISGPAGDKDWAKFERLFYPGATMGATVTRPNGTSFRKFSPAEYVKLNAPLFKKFAFTEKEIGRTVNEFGSIAQVFTAYEYTLVAEKTETARGINSLQLVKDQGRWWILSLIWDDETKDLKIPATYLSK